MTERDVESPTGEASSANVHPPKEDICDSSPVTPGIRIVSGQIYRYQCTLHYKGANGEDGSNDETWEPMPGSAGPGFAAGILDMVNTLPDEPRKVRITPQSLVRAMCFKICRLIGFKHAAAFNEMFREMCRPDMLDIEQHVGERGSMGWSNIEDMPSCHVHGVDSLQVEKLLDRLRNAGTKVDDGTHPWRDRFVVESNPEQCNAAIDTIRRLMDKFPPLCALPATMADEEPIGTMVSFLLEHCRDEGTFSKIKVHGCDECDSNCLTPGCPMRNQLVMALFFCCQIIHLLGIFASSKADCSTAAEEDCDHDREVRTTSDILGEMVSSIAPADMWKRDDNNVCYFGWLGLFFGDQVVPDLDIEDIPFQYTTTSDSVRLSRGTEDDTYNVIEGIFCRKKANSEQEVDAPFEFMSVVCRRRPARMDIAEDPGQPEHYADVSERNIDNDVSVDTMIDDPAGDIFTDDTDDNTESMVVSDQVEKRHGNDADHANTVGVDPGEAHKNDTDDDTESMVVSDQVERRHGNDADHANTVGVDPGEAHKNDTDDDTESMVANNRMDRSHGNDSTDMASTVNGPMETLTIDAGGIETKNTLNQPVDSPNPGSGQLNESVPPVLGSLPRKTSAPREIPQPQTHHRRRSTAVKR